MEDRDILLKILEKVEGIEQDVSVLKSDSSKTKQDISALKQNLSVVQQNIFEMKDDFAEVRGGVNQLLDWVEEAQVQVQIPLFKKSIKE